MWPSPHHAAGNPSSSTSTSIPRLVKHRRPASVDAPRFPSTGGASSTSTSSEASNPARATWIFSAFGSSWKETSDGSSDPNLPEELRNPRISERSSAASSLPQEFRNLSVGEGSNHGSDRAFVFRSGSSQNPENPPRGYPIPTGVRENQRSVSGSYGQTIASTLPEDMRRLNIEGSRESESNSGRTRTFVFGSGGNVGRSHEGNVADACRKSATFMLPEDMKKLNIGDDVGEGVFVFGSVKDGDAAGALPNEIRKLNIGTAKGKEGRNFVDGGGLKNSYFGDLYGTSDLTKNMHKLDIGDPKSSVGGWEELKNGMGKNGETKQYESSSGINGNFSIRSQYISQGKGQDGSTGSNVNFSTTENGASATGNNVNFSARKNGTSGASFVGAGSGSVGSPGFVFTTPGEGRESPRLFFSRASRDSVFSGIGHATPADMNVGASKDAKKHKRRNKSRQPASLKLGKDGFSLRREDSLPESFDSGSPGSYSPMDFSPYESIVLEHCSGKDSLVSEEPTPFDSGGVANESSGIDEIANLVFKTQSTVIDASDVENTEASGGAVKVQVENIGADAGTSLSGEQIPETNKDTNLFSSKVIGFEGLNFVADDIKKVNFPFAAPASAAASSQGPRPTSKHIDHRKNRMRMGRDSYKWNPSFNFHLGSSSANTSSISAFPNFTNFGENCAPMQEVSSITSSSVSQTPGEKVFATDKDAINQGTIPATSEGDLILEACEKWRLRGNQAYADRNFSKAEEYYTRGMDCITLEESSSSHRRALMFCHSNRAATRMSLGRMREALADCYISISIDPAFVKAYLRAANCHLALGETKDASQLFKKCIQLVDKDSKAASSEASGGLQKAQQVENYVRRSTELLKKRSTDDASDALTLISDALHLSPYSEELLELKANALFMLQRYGDAIKLSEQTFDSAEENAAVSQEFSDVESKNMLIEGMNYSLQKIWRWNLIAKSYFYMGRLEEALNLLEKNKIVRLSLDKSLNSSLKSLISFSVTLQELVHQKAAGNNAFQANRHTEAVEHYSAAISCSTESRSFAAICFCNRAAAYQALGQVTDAIADCSLAIALDGSYAKAISRRGTLHEMIRDYDQAINDLSRLILILEGRIKDGSEEGKRPCKSDDANDLKRARVQLSALEDEARKSIPLDLYTILGVEPSSSTAEIKKAYRRAALKHHPDKACQLLTRSENSDDGLWKELADEVHKDADHLFKMIGEAYAILSDRSKRLHYDTEEETRSVSKSQNCSTTGRSSGDFQRSYSDRSSCYSRQSGNSRNSSGFSRE